MLLFDVFLKVTWEDWWDFMLSGIVGNVGIGFISEKEEDYVESKSNNAAQLTPFTTCTAYVTHNAT